jgi:hypothetical protein
MSVTEKKINQAGKILTGPYANLYCSMGRYDSAMAIANRMDTFVPVGIFPGLSALLGEIHLNGTKEYDKAIKEFTRVRDTVVKYIGDTIYATAPWLIKIGRAYDGKKDYKTCFTIYEGWT